jgi:hypothetical protein
VNWEAIGAIGISLAELFELTGNNPLMAELVMRAHDKSTRPEDLSPEEFAQRDIACSVLCVDSGGNSAW